MNRRVLSFLAWFLAAAAFAQEPADSAAFMGYEGAWVQRPGGEREPLVPGPMPFGLGEKMDFVVRYGAVEIGEASLELRRPTLLQGRQAWEITNQARSASWVDRIFKIRDRVQSFMDLERGFSLGFGKQLREGRYKRDMHADYLQSEGVARYKEGDMELTPGSHDILTALYFIRRVKLEPGMRLGLPLHDDKKNYQVEVEVQSREVVETELGPISCLVLEPTLQSGGIFNKAGRLWLWLSDDERRLIVQLKSKAPVGAFASVLRAYTPPRQEEP